MRVEGVMDVNPSRDGGAWDVCFRLDVDSPPKFVRLGSGKWVNRAHVTEVRDCANGVEVFLLGSTGFIVPNSTAESVARELGRVRL